MTAEAPSPASHIPPAIVGQTVTLRAISRDDMLTLFRWRTDTSELHLLSSSKRIPLFEEFAAEMKRTLPQSITFLVIDKEDGQPIGYVQAYNLNMEAGWCFSTAYFEKPYRGTSQSTEAFVALLDYLFRYFDLRKVYTEVSEFNLDSMKFIEAGGFVEEGRFREHVWFDGKYWDSILFAVYQEVWAERRDQVRFLLDVGEDAAELLQEQHDQSGGLA